MASKDYRFDHRSLIRLTTWGAGAAVALIIAALTSITSTGSQRIGNVRVALTGSGAPSQVTTARLTQPPANGEAERRGLTEALRLLAADRDRLLNRVASLERNFDDMTGSIKRQAEQPPLPQIPNWQPHADKTSPETPTAAAPITNAATPASSTALAALEQDVPEWLADRQEFWPRASVAFDIASAPAAAATRTEFGVDIGGGSDLEEVRALWNAARAKHSRLLAGLHPIIALREARTGGLEIRLIVGPLANASAAAKLCARFGAADVMCSTSPFDGQRLAMR
ncbi:MAG: hypothetical protein WD073_06210 [Xanthobacteraceae bacterium]